MRAHLPLLCLLPGLGYAADKVDVCHRGGPNVQLISVSAPAVPAHQAHGDSFPGVWYADRDHDGAGDPSAATTACAAPAGFVAIGSDCDDDDGLVHPDAGEVCDGIDQDCDGTVDDGEIGSTWYFDLDGDAFGDPLSAVVRCVAPPGTTADATDCDDADAAVNPNASETCSAVDDDCDGVVNEPDAVDAAVWFVDADGDGAGDPSTGTSACEAPAGSVSTDDDCDDADGTRHPRADERCDGLDEDCDGSVDEDATDASPWYADADGDGHGAGAPALACVAPPGFVGDAADCDDASSAVGPGVAEGCNGVDDDCDGVVDEPDAVDAATFFLDVDGDGFGDDDAWALACTLPAGHSEAGGDCDDADPTAYPYATEICDDGVDQSCDGVADEACVLATFPLEVIGPNGTTVSMTFPLSEADAGRPTLYLQVHDLDFDGEGAVQLDDGPWWSLQDELDPGDPGAGPETVHVEVLGESAVGYGGLGGMFNTLKLELDLPPGSLHEGENTLSFRFVETDGVTSGFRVLDVDLRDAAGQGLFADSDFAHADPNDWQPIYTDAASLAEGERLWRTAALTEPNNGAISAHCADCHTQDGRDLKYFGYSDHSIIERAKFHELTEEEGRLIASFIRTRPVRSPGRPWNPPYQPGPGTDDKPVEEWAAGAGIDQVLDDDHDTIEYLFPDGPSEAAILDRPVQLRNVPIHLQLLDWNHWLPEVAPTEGLAQLDPVPWGVPQVIDGVEVPPNALQVFRAGLLRHYDGPADDPDGVFPPQVSAREALRSAVSLEERCAVGEVQLERLVDDLERVMNVVPRFETDGIVQEDLTRSGRFVNSTARWTLVKRFELHQEFGLEECGPVLQGERGESRSWIGTIAGAVPQVEGMSREGAQNFDPRQPRLAIDYASNAWWTLQLIQNFRDGEQHAVFWTPYFRTGQILLGVASGAVDVGRSLAMNLVAFQTVAAETANGVDVNRPFAWDPIVAGDLDWLSHDAFSRRTRETDSDGRPVTGVHPHTQGLPVEEHAAILGAFMDAWVTVGRRVPLELWHAPLSSGWPMADADYDSCDHVACWSEPGWTSSHGVHYPDPVVIGSFPDNEWVAADSLRFMLTWARELFVDLETRQRMADFAAELYPAIDWQSFVDDLGPRQFADESVWLEGIEVAVDPGAYGLPWYWTPTGEWIVGPRTVTMYPGKSQIALGDGVGSLDVLVYPDGTVVPFDPRTATGGDRTLTFETTSVRIDPGEWTGSWSIPSVVTTATTGPRDVVVVAGFEYSVGIASRGLARFTVESPDALSTTTPASVALAGTTVSFRTLPVTFHAGAYEESWGIEYGPRGTNGDATLDLVPGLDYWLMFGSGGGPTISVAEDGAVTFPLEAANAAVADGRDVWFTPWDLTVATDAPQWSFEHGPQRYGDATVAILPTGWYQLQVHLGTGMQPVSVGAACEVDPASFVRDGYTFALSCAPPADPGLPTWTTDADGDGYGDDATGRARPTGADDEVRVGGDCDDLDPTVHPGAVETWYDGVDQDCSGDSDLDRDGDGVSAPDGDCDELDPAVGGPGTWYADGDGDGAGDPATAVQACTEPPGSVADATDCDDASALVGPDATEVCNAVDDDCDGTVDEPDAVDAATFTIDADGDGFGDAGHEGIGPAQPDADADGRPDLLVGDHKAPWGHAYVYTGEPAGLSHTIAQDLVAPVYAGWPSAQSVLLGDLDGDGGSEIATSANNVVYLYRSGPGGFEATPYQEIPNPGTTDGFGYWMAAPGDVDGDGQVELLAGSDGQAFLFRGLGDGTFADAPLAQLDGVLSDQFGRVGSAGDLDGDGHAEVVVTAYAANGFAGQAHVWFGDEAGLSTAAVVLDAPAWGMFGRDRPVADDFDLDGYDDLVIASPMEPGGGAIYVYRGSPDGLPAAPVRIPGFVGWTLIPIGDFTGDGYPDLAATAEPVDVVILAGGPDGLQDTAWARLTTPESHPDDVIVVGRIGDTLAIGRTFTQDVWIYTGGSGGTRTTPDDVLWLPAGAAPSVLLGYQPFAQHGAVAGATVTACSPPPGFVADASDCDDALAATNPAATETCNAVDDDCDGLADETGAAGEAIWHADADGDGFGDPGATALSCAVPAGHVADGTDCDDLDPAVHPAAGETCDGLDQDCDGTADEDAADATTWYADRDIDGSGDPSAPTMACQPPAFHVADAGDCDDADPRIHAFAVETCDGVDEDCDGEVDAPNPTGPVWWPDEDGDGYGVRDVDGDGVEESINACDQPEGFVLAEPFAEDCDGQDPAVHPFADEYCNGIDEDCDAVTDDDALDALTWYFDVDLDGYGSERVGTDMSGYLRSCEQPVDRICPTGCPESFGYSDTIEVVVLDDTDCDDDDDDVHPGAEEVCNAVDDDCDGATDEAGALGEVTWYPDGDGDTYGNAAADPRDVVVACDEPPPLYGTVPYVRDGTECDDGRADVHPGAPETCDGADQDCDAITDEDAGCDRVEGSSGGSDYALVFSDTALSWLEAELACESEGGHLAVITSADEQAFLDQLTTWPDAAWVGGSDRVAEGAWEWITGEAFAYERWEPGEPNSVGDEDCIVTPWDDGAWNDVTCDDPRILAYLCEFDGLDPLLDTDADGVPDDADNCPSLANPLQQDDDADGVGILCDCDDARPEVGEGAEDALVAWFTLDALGSAADDASGCGRQLVAQGGAFLGWGGAVDLRNPPGGPGPDQLVDPAADPLYDLGGIDRAFTLSLHASWDSASATSGVQVLAENLTGDGAGGGTGWTLEKLADHTILFDVRTDVGVLTPQLRSGPLSLGDGAYHHFAVTRTEAGRFTLYVDGVAVSVVDWPGASIVPSAQVFRVGQRNPADPSGAGMDGLVDDLALWATDLDATQITDLAAGRASPGEVVTAEPETTW